MGSFWTLKGIKKPTRKWISKRKKKEKEVASTCPNDTNIPNTTNYVGVEELENISSSKGSEKTRENKDYSGIFRERDNL